MLKSQLSHGKIRRLRKGPIYRLRRITLVGATGEAQLAPRFCNTTGIALSSKLYLIDGLVRGFAFQKNEKTRKG